MSTWTVIDYRTSPPPSLPQGTYCIYALADPRTRKFRYIGATRRWVFVRFIEHMKAARPGSKRREQTSDWIQELVEAGLVPELRILEVVPEERWESAERGWIRRYKHHELLNISSGGKGKRGPLSYEHKQAISLGKLGKDNGGRGKAKTPEHRAKIAAAMRNHHASRRETLDAN